MAEAISQDGAAASPAETDGGDNPEATKAQRPVVENQFLYRLYQAEGLPSIHDTNTLRRWLRRLGEELGVELCFTTAMMTKVYKRASYIVTTLRRLRHGRQRQLFLEKEWYVPLSSSDIKSEREVTLEAKLEEAEAGKDRLEKANAALKKTGVKLKEQVTRLSDQVQKAKSTGFRTTRGHSRIKSPSKCTQRHRRALKRKRADKCTDALAWLEVEGYSATKVLLRSEKTGEEETINLEKDGFLGPEESSISDEELEKLNMMLYVKDRFNVSGGAYHEMAQLCRDMPRHYKLKDRISELNKLWNIRPTPEGTCGVQQSLEDRLRLCVERLISRSPSDADFIKNKKLRVKLTGDGTNIGGRMQWGHGSDTNYSLWTRYQNKGWE